MLTLEGADSITTVSTLTEVPGIKQRQKTRKLSRDKNIERVTAKELAIEKRRGVI